MKKDNMKHNNKTVIKSNIKNVQNVDRKVKFRKDLPAIILVVCMLFWTVGSLISFVLGARSCADKTIEASAEYVQPTDYETANLFPLKYQSGNLVRDGLTVVVNDNGSITLNGTTTRQIIYYFVTVTGSLPYGMQVGETYTLSCSTMVSNRIVLYANYWNGSTWVNANWIVSSDSVSPRKTIPNTWQGLQQYFIIYANQTFDNETFYPMLTKGSTLYPFQPNYEYFYNQGESDGYDTGREEVMKKGDISFLYGATATLDYARYGANESATGKLSVDGSQVSFTGIISNYTSVSNITARIDLAVPTDGRNIYWVAYGNRSAFYDGDSPKVFTAVTSDGSTYSARWNYLDDFGYYGLELSTAGVYDIELSYLRSWYIGSATDLQSIYFRAPNSAYRSGYDLGYTDGLNDNSYVQQAFQNGQDLGFKNGFEKGKTYGIEHANDYSFIGLLSAVFDVPIKAFRGLLNFEVLGVNLSGFYLSLLTACFVLIVVKLVM